MSKFINFIVKMFTKTAAVVKTLEAITPATLSVILAIFYDIVKIASTVEGDIETKNIGDIFSAQTKALFADFLTDLKAGKQQVVADATALELSFKTSATASNTTVA